MLGAWLTNRRERRTAKERDERDIVHLAVVVGRQLSEFADACYEVATDEGASESSTRRTTRLRQQNRWKPSVKYPELFNPPDVDVSWKVLPKDLLVAILRLPAQLESAVSSAKTLEMPGLSANALEAHRCRFARLFLDASAACAQLDELAQVCFHVVPLMDYERLGECERLIRAHESRRAQEAEEWRKREAQRVNEEEGDWHDATGRTC
ncbi:hypothetical protein FHT38_000348 [Mitsuaria sp. BK041]|nr:hypothetical protein [Mitsuaria sp. BK041]MBB3291709.1 hypothetical protein [Mitsuaria sp. BK041]